MTADVPRRFPVVLTLAAAVAFAILCGFGIWQLQRLAWKRDLIARIEAAQAAPPKPLAEVLARAARGENVDFARVSVVCLPDATPAPRVMLYGLKDGQAVWRPIAPCRIDAAGYRLIAVDRGVAAGEATTPPALDLPRPVRVEGVLRRPDVPTAMQRVAGAGPQTAEGGYYDRTAAMAALGPAGQSPGYMLVAERETPAPTGITPAPLPLNISNRHIEYVITWFGLALALAGVYAAMLMKRLRG